MRDAPFPSSSKIRPLLSLPLPSILFSVYSLPRSVRPSIFPSLFHPSPTRFLSFSHVRPRARAFGLFSCFYAPLVFSLPKYNWRCDAPVSLSLSTLWLPSPLALSSASPDEDRESSFGESWTRAGNSLTRGCRRQEALIARYLGLIA